MSRPPAPDSLRLRLSRRLALLAFVGLGAVSVAVYAVIAWTLAARQDETLAQKQAAVRHLLAEERGAHDLTSTRHLLNDFLAGHDELTLQIADAAGRPLYETAGRTLPQRRSKQLAFSVQMPDGRGGLAHAVLVLDKRDDEALLRRLAWTLALTALVGTVAVSLGGFLLVRVGLAPLGRLVAQTGQVSALRLDVRLDGSGQVQELQPLVAQINALLDRLAVAYGQMEAFNADVAHELNTPLATLISSCELALRRPREAAELREALASNLEELHRIAAIVGDMLFLSSAERGAAARRTPQASLAALAAEVVEFHEAALHEAGLHARLEGDAALAVDAPLLRRAVSNLLGNATRFGKRGTEVVIRIEAQPGGVEISVGNHGPAIAPEHLPRLFDRFYRVDAARTHAAGHHGLGLAIVAAIARMHGGQVSARSSDGVTRIGLSLQGDA